MSDLISRQAAIDAICKACSMEGDYHKCDGYPETSTWCDELVALRALPSAQPERLTDDDFETIRIHLNAFKENLCNQQRWGEAEEYQRIIDRFMAFASAQSERWIPCSERLPFAEYGESETVFTTCKHREPLLGDGGYLWVKLLYFNGSNWCHPTGEVFDDIVIAWMPLPEPWRGEE